MGCARVLVVDDEEMVRFSLCKILEKHGFACLQACRWQSENAPFLTMAVNVSSIEFGCRNFVAGVRDVLTETGLAPQYLQLELTESILMKHAEETVSVLNDLRKMGVQVAVDDFGTGYSSLSYLRQFPISVLKIDQSFVRQITQESDDCSPRKRHHWNRAKS
jgi:EAL domain-containing protein (putative c-di-GMP-specific phosphodiesterase class I)